MLCFKQVSALGRESFRAVWPLPGESLSYCPGPVQGRQPPPWSDSLLSEWHRRVERGLHSLGLPLSALGQVSWGRGGGRGNGGKSRPAVPGKSFCPTREGWRRTEAGACPSCETPTPEGELEAGGQCSGCTAGSRAARSLTGSVGHGQVRTPVPPTPNVLTEIQVFMSECFSACCILFKIIFTSCGGSTREKGARASTRRPLTQTS